MSALFNYWLKKKESKFLRIGKFYQNMVVFGLAPNTQYLAGVLHNYSEQVKQPSFAYTTHPNPKVDQIERRKIKPFNKQFVYKLNFDGTLEISHISLDAFIELYKVNKLILNFHSYLKQSLLKKHVEHLIQKMQKVGYAIDQKKQSLIQK